MNLTPNPDDIDLDQFEDFDSHDFWSYDRPADSGYLNNMWGRTGFGRRDSEAAVIAHGMVQSVVNAFSRGERYRVVFDPNTSTAGTDFEARKITVTTAPILDQTITAEQAGLILTALAAHEISHPRYGKATAKAVEVAFPRNRLAQRLGNILDDVRIERRFVGDYPGYAGIFEPLLEYVGAATMKKNGGRQVTPAITDQANIAAGALRYPMIVDWTGIEAERDWWLNWADRWSREDSPRRHVEAIRIALRHVVETREEAKAASPTQPQKSKAEEDATNEDKDAGQDAESAASGDEPDDSEKIDADAAGTDSGASHEEDAEEDEELDDDELNAATQDEDAGDEEEMPSCAGGDSVENAAEENGVDDYEMERAAENAQEAIDAARDGEDDGHGGTVDVARSLKGLIHGRLDYRSSQWITSADAASRHIRDAILRSRSGHTGVATYQKRGRLDNRGLHRIAAGDTRLFSKRHAPDPGKYLVWVMIDTSSSMAGNAIREAAQVAEAIAMASRSTPNTRVEVWGWSDAYRPNRGGAGVARVWKDGQPTTDVRKVADLSMGGTPDVPVIGWAARAIRREAKGGEQPVIIFCSDGQGNNGAAATKRAVDEARSLGVDMRSVALGRAVDDDDQLEMYGKDGYVPFQGSVLATALPLGRMIARITGKAQR